MRALEAPWETPGAAEEGEQSRCGAAPLPNHLSAPHIPPAPPPLIIIIIHLSFFLNISSSMLLRHRRSPSSALLLLLALPFSRGSAQVSRPSFVCEPREGKGHLIGVTGRPCQRSARRRRLPFLQASTAIASTSTSFLSVAASVPSPLPVRA